MITFKNKYHVRSTHSVILYFASRLLPRDAMLARYMLSSCVCLAVCVCLWSVRETPVLYQNG